MGKKDINIQRDIFFNLSYLSVQIQNTRNMFVFGKDKQKIE